MIFARLISSSKGNDSESWMVNPDPASRIYVGAEPELIPIEAAVFDVEEVRKWCGIDEAERGLAVAAKAAPIELDGRCGQQHTGGSHNAVR